MTTKIILNRPALERLFEADSDTELAFKKAAVKEVLSKHLKAVLDDKLVREIQYALEVSATRQLEEELGKVKKKTWSQPAEVHLNEPYKEQIEKLVRNAATMLIEDAIDKIDIASYVDAKVNALLVDKINQGVKEKFDKAMRQA